MEASSYSARSTRMNPLRQDKRLKLTLSKGKQQLFVEQRFAGLKARRLARRDVDGITAYLRSHTSERGSTAKIEP